MMAAQNSREQVKQNVLKNHEREIVNFFEKYRTFVNKNPQFRKRFFGYLKIQIVESLNVNEKHSLMRKIERNLHFNQTAVHPNNGMFDSSYNPMGIATYSTDNYIPYSYSSNEPIISHHGNRNNDTFESWNCDDDVIITRSTEPRDAESIELSNVDSLPISSISISADDLSSSEDESSPSNDVENGNDNIAAIKKLFNEISEMIKKNEMVTKKLQQIRNSPSKLIYQGVLNYVPRNEIDPAYKKDPILFQLALNIDTQKSALDLICRDNLLNLNLRNQHKMSIYNVLLFTSFACLCKFMVYIKNKNIKNNIKYVYSTNEELSSLWSRQNMSTSKSKEKMLRDFQSCVDGQPILEDSYLRHLADDLSGFFTHIDTIISVDPSIILNSSFLVLLAELDINHCFNFVQNLISAYKVDLAALCKSIELWEHEGKTVVSIIDANAETKFNRSVRLLKNFITEYKNSRTDKPTEAKKTTGPQPRKR